MTDEFKSLADRVRVLRHPNNYLDVEVEIALFEPGTCYKAVRANAAGTKVIYTDHEGHQVTCWARDWTAIGRRSATIAALFARGLKA